MARNSARDKGIGMRQAFAGNPVGAGISAQQTGLGLNAGTGAVGNAGVGANAWLPGAQYASGGVGNQLGAAQMGINSQLGLGGLMNSGFSTQAGMYNANQGMDIGGLMRGGAALYTAFNPIS